MEAPGFWDVPEISNKKMKELNRKPVLYSDKILKEEGYL